jgi:hypothetical protein
MGVDEVDDRWVTVRLSVADLLNAVGAWATATASPNWPVVRPPIARLARIARQIDDDDAPSPRPADPRLRVELLVAARAAAEAGGQLHGPGAQHEVAMAAAGLNTALWKIPDAEFQLDPAEAGTDPR